MPEGITFQGLDQLNATLASLTGPGLAAVIQRSALQIGHELVNKLQRYPTRKGPVQWDSPKQRAWYHAMRKAKGLPLKYTRRSDPMSQKVGQSWGVTKFGNTGAIAGNRATYSHFVQSAAHQTGMHEATGWPTDEQAVEELDRGNRIPKIVMGNLDKFISRKMRGAGG